MKTMKTMGKYLKEHVLMILLIVVLLIVQAFSDLALPDYTSNIVNVGIQQSGVESVVFDAIRESELEKLYMFMTEDEKSFVQESYSLIGDSDDAELLEKYPRAKDQRVMKLQDVTKGDLEKLEDVFSVPAIILLQQTTGMSMDKMGVTTSENMTMEEIIDMVKKQLEALPDTTISQISCAYTKMEYEALGVDILDLQTKYILIAGLKMLGFALISMLCAILVGYIASVVGSKVSRNMRRDVFTKVVSFSSGEFDKFSTASLITRTTNDIQQVQMLIIMGLRMVLYAPILGIGAFTKVASTQLSMSWVIGVAVVSVLLVVVVLFSFAIPKFTIIQKLVDRVNLVTREMLTGLPVIKAFSKEQYEEKRFDKANKDLTSVNLFISRTMSTMMPTMMLIMNATTVLIVWVGAKNIDSGSMQVGDIMAFIQYAMQIVMAFLMLSMMSIMLPRAWVSVKRMSEVLYTEPSIVDKDTTVIPSDDTKGLVEFKNVNFRYQNADEDVLKNINFTAKKGETTAFIGSTGCGKSTLINLIPRMFDVTGGEVLVDGVDVRDMPQHELRSRIGYVPQKGVLFSGTIDSNLRYGKEDATQSEIEKAVEIAQAMDFVKSKEDGFNSPIAQGGANVSGGQKQRLCIARAVAIDPEIYIFDDSFSALDYKTDANLRKALKEQTNGSTVLIVAQRISTVMNAEQIIVLEEGEIVGKGTHQELLKTCEVYKQIALSQLSKEELSNG